MRWSYLWTEKNILEPEIYNLHVVQIFTSDPSGAQDLPSVLLVASSSPFLSQQISASHNQ